MQNPHARRSSIKSSITLSANSGRGEPKQNRCHFRPSGQPPVSDGERNGRSSTPRDFSSGDRIEDSEREPPSLAHGGILSQRRTTPFSYSHKGSIRKYVFRSASFFDESVVFRFLRSSTFGLSDWAGVEISGERTERSSYFRFYDSLRIDGG